VNCVRKVVNS